MDKNLQFVIEKRVNRTIEALEKNNISGYFVSGEAEIFPIIEGILKNGDTVAVGGSMTLEETGVLDFLRTSQYKFLDRYEKGITQEELRLIYIKSFMADGYFTSTNAITEDGELYNVDGNGNRVAAMLYGPEKVIIICGVNKLVKNLDEAIIRNKEVSAPANAKRLNRNTPCAKVGYCMDCSSEDRICNEYTIIKRQKSKGRITVIFVNKELGY